MKNTEFTTLMNTVTTTISIAKIDEMTEKVASLLTNKQREAYSNAANERREVLTNGVQTSLFDNERENNTMGKTNEEVKNELVTDDKKINAAVARIEKKIGTIEKGYLGIIGDVAYLAENDGAKALGYKNIYELCADKFGMARGTVHNLLSIYKRFGDGNYGLTDEANGLGVRAMLAQIKNEADARKALEDNGGATVTDGDGDEDNEDTSKDSKAKVDIIDFDFTNADKWSVDDLLDKIREELEAGGITDVDANSNIIFKITH